MKNVERYLDSFGKYVVKQARTNLTKKKKNVNKDLYNSLKFIVEKKGQTDYSIKFYMADYGTFVDKGVQGTNKRQTYRDYRDKEVKSPYQYTNKQPPSGIIEKWIAARGIRGRNTKGQFTSITRKSLAFLIARGIKRKGIPAASFYTQPLSYSFNKFKKDMIQHFKTDILNEIKTFKK